MLSKLVAPEFIYNRPEPNKMKQDDSPPSKNMLAH